MIHVDPSDLSLARRARVISEFQASIADAPSRFRVGDIITYEDAEGWHRVVTVLLLTPSGGAAVMIYDGQPHFEAIDLADLNRLRVMKIDFMEQEDVEMYLDMLSPPTNEQEMELAA